MGGRRERDVREREEGLGDKGMGAKEPETNEESAIVRVGA